MPKNDSTIKDRLSALKQDIDTLTKALGAFAVGLDKVSQVQANQTEVIEGLVRANETMSLFLKRLLDNSVRSNKLLDERLPHAKAVEEIKNRLDEFERRTKKEGGVFISYSHADKDLVYVLSQRFEKDSINYWLDDKDLLVGEVIDKAISDGIQKSWLFIIVLSPTSIKSKWVQREFDEASYEEIEGKKIILPVTVNGLQANKLPTRVRRKLFVNLTDDFEVGYKKLRKSILTYLAEFSQKVKQ